MMYDDTINVNKHFNANIKLAFYRRKADHKQQHFFEQSSDSSEMNGIMRDFILKDDTVAPLLELPSFTQLYVMSN